MDNLLSYGCNVNKIFAEWWKLKKRNANIKLEHWHSDFQKSFALSWISVLYLYIFYRAIVNFYSRQLIHMNSKQLWNFQTTDLSLPVFSLERQCYFFLCSFKFSLQRKIKFGYSYSVHFKQENKTKQIEKTSFTCFYSPQEQ